MTKDMFWFTKNKNGIYFHFYYMNNGEKNYQNSIEYLQGGKFYELIDKLLEVSPKIYSKNYKIKFDKDTALSFSKEEKQLIIHTITKLGKEAKKANRLEKDIIKIYNSLTEKIRIHNLTKT